MNQQYLPWIEKIDRMQKILIARATGNVEYSHLRGTPNSDYKNLRQEILSEKRISDKIPDFIKEYRDTYQFWLWIKKEYSTYQERRDFIWSSFKPILNYLEDPSLTPIDELVIENVSIINSEYVTSYWHKMMERRDVDPEGAITASRTLLECVCKHILDDENIPYPADVTLPKLFQMTSEKLGLAPSQHSEPIFKQILGGCTAIVEGLGALRNRISDAHGQGKKPVKPSVRHAELAVNLSGSMASFIIATWEFRKSS